MTQEDTPCILPWIDPINELEHTGCSKSDNDTLGDWCPTEVNEHGKFEPKSGKWGYCNESCPSDYSKYNIFFRKLSQHNSLHDCT